LRWSRKAKIYYGVGRGKGKRKAGKSVNWVKGGGWENGGDSAEIKEKLIMHKPFSGDWRKKEL